jgi:serine/threonine protein kinase
MAEKGGMAAEAVTAWPPELPTPKWVSRLIETFLGLPLSLAQITDFGVSRVLADEHMGLCNVAGTLLFMAPEVGANLVAISEYDHSADMWR